MGAFLRLQGYVRRSVTRAPARSLLTVLGAALALGLFAFVRTLERGVERLTQASDVPVLVVFQSSRFCPLTSVLPMYYAGEIEAVEGVTSVLPTLLHINSCRANLDLVPLHGVYPDVVEGFYRLRALEGDLESWKRSHDGALVGHRLAERRGVRVNDRVRLGNVDLRVGGIVTATGGGLDNVAFVHLDHLQLARDRQGLATEFLVRLAPGADPEEVAARIDERFASAPQATDTKTMQAFVQGAVREVAEVVDFARLLGYLAVAVMALILGNTVWISAHTRFLEFGVLRTLGARRPLAAALVVAEGLGLALVGGLLGAGAVALWLHLDPKTLGIEGYGIDLVPEAALFLLAAGVSLIVGLVASVGPALEILRLPLARALGSR